jgi:CBS domain-containing protein
MKIVGPAKRLTIYLGESDQWRGRPLGVALLECLRREGLAGATLTRAVGGFGAHSRIHTTTILRLSEDLPQVLEVVDSAERIDHAVAVVGHMIQEGLITVEDVQVIKYSHRYLAPLPGERPVGEFMSAPAIAVGLGEPLGQAWGLMVEHGLKALPVVDEKGHPVGMITDGDFMEKTGLVQRLAVAERLDAATLADWRAGLDAKEMTVQQVMSAPVVTLRADSPLGKAATLMTERSLKRLPVVDADGVLAGVLSRVDILGAVTHAHKGHRARPPAGALRALGEVMEHHIPAVAEDSDLPEVLDQMVASGFKRVVVLDSAGRPLGLITDGDLVARVRPESRPGLLQALARRGRAPSDETLARDLMSPGVLALPADTPVTEAIQRAVANRRKRVLVVDGEGRAVGIIDREDLLKAIVS